MSLSFGGGKVSTGEKEVEVVPYGEKVSLPKYSLSKKIKIKKKESLIGGSRGKPITEGGGNLWTL